MSILQSKYTNLHSAKIELSCTLCRVNTKSKGKTIQNFYSFCYQTLHLYNKVSFVLNFLVKVWVSSGETKIQVFKSNDRNSTSKIATKKKQRSPQKTRLQDIIFEKSEFNHCNKLSWDNCSSVMWLYIFHSNSFTVLTYMY